MHSQSKCEFIYAGKCFISKLFASFKCTNTATHIKLKDFSYSNVKLITNNLSEYINRKIPT